MSGERLLLVVHQSAFLGESRGLYAQHVASLRALLDGHGGWRVAALDPLHQDFPDAVLRADVVVVHMLPQREIETALRLRRARGRPTVFEIGDNFLALGPWLPRHHALRSPLVRQRLLLHASLADALQVYAPGLRALFARVNPRVALFDPYVPLPDAPPEKPPGFVFGWTGTTSHEDDLRRVAPAVVELCARHPDAVFAYMGDLAMFGRHFAAIPRAQTRVAPFAPYETYLAFVRELHAGIATAGRSGFDAARSDTKLLTYAAAAAAPLVDDAPPYDAHADHAIPFRDAGELLAALERLHADRALLAALAARAFAWAREARGADRLRAQRDDFYRGLLPTPRPTRARRAEVRPAAPHAARLAALGACAAEDRLAAARESVAADPGYAPGRWLVASTLQALGRVDEALEAARRFSWPAVYADGVAELRARAAARTRPADAERHIARIHSPVARLRLRPRGPGDPDAHFRAVLAEQPYDHFALHAVIRRLERDDPGSRELPALYERACLVAPESVPPARRPASLTPFLAPSPAP